MAEVIVSSDSLAIFGGPSVVDLNIDYGPPGQRGSLIFSGEGQPNTITFSTQPQPLDLYINLKPGDFEYLFLYQYGYTNGVLTWSKVLRLVPNTALANIPVIFYNGEAVTFTPVIGLPESLESFVDPENIDFDEIDASLTEPSTPELYDLWLDLSESPLELKSYVTLIDPETNEVIENPITGLPVLAWVTLGTIVTGLKFPVGDYFDLASVAIPPAVPSDTLNKIASFIVQYTILNDTPVSSGLTVGELSENETDSKIYLEFFLKAIETAPFNPNPLVEIAWNKITGIRDVNVIIVGNIATIPEDEINLS
jgi:hypothetical protein